MAGNFTRGVIRVEGVGFIIGKERIPAREVSVMDGKSYPAKAESFNLYLAIGELRQKSNLIGATPIIVSAQTTRDCFKRVASQSAVHYNAKQKNGQYYTVTAIDGIELVGLKEDETDEDDDCDDVDNIDDVVDETMAADIKKSKSKKVVIE